jgi:hypothetical protein
MTKSLNPDTYNHFLLRDGDDKKVTRLKMVM